MTSTDDADDTLVAEAFDRFQREMSEDVPSSERREHAPRRYGPRPLTIAAATVTLLALGVGTWWWSARDVTEVTSTATNSAPDAVTYLISVFEDWNANAHTYYEPLRLTDLVPGAAGRSGVGAPGGGGAPDPGAHAPDLVVVGEIIEVETGTAFSLPDAEPPDDAPNDGQIEVPFGDKTASWQTVHATVLVDHALGDAGNPPARVTVGFVIYPNVDVGRYREGLLGLGPAIFFLDEDNAVFDYRDGVYSVFRDATIATIAADGTLELPFVEPGTTAPLQLSATPTLRAFERVVRER